MLRADRPCLSGMAHSEVTPRKDQQFRDLQIFKQAVGIERHSLRVRKEDLFDGR